MNRLWERIIFPIINFKQVKLIVEIGAEKGINTKNILNYCLENNAKLISIDPKPLFDIDDFKEKYGDFLTFYKELSLERLPLLNNFDCVLIDGDHNWYTVYHELKCIGEKFNSDNFPLIFLHDVSWPYGRRDLYYDPNNIPKEYINEYSQLGMHPDSEELLSEYGLNSSLFNANEENTHKNGVLTAVEDFIAESNFNLELHIFPMFFGLGIIHKKDEVLSNFIQKIFCDKEILNLVELFYIKQHLHDVKVISQRNNLMFDLEKRLSRTTSQLKNLNVENSNLKDELSKLEDEFDHINILSDSLNQTNIFLTKNNENQLNEINCLKSDLDSYKKTIEIFTEKNNILKELSEKQKTELLSLYKELTGCTIKLRECESKLVTNKNNLNKLSANFDSLSKINTHLKEVNNLQQNEISQIKEDNNKLNEIIEVLSENNLILKAVNGYQLNIINNLNVKYDELGASNKNLQKYKSKHDEKVFELNQANYKIKYLFNKNSKLLNNEEKLQNKINILNNQLINANALISDLNKQIGAKQDEMDNFKMLIQNNVTKKYNLEQENAYLKKYPHRCSSEK